MFGAIPVQMYQFHQTQIIIRYLTRNPKPEVSKKLRMLSLKIKKKELVFELGKWNEKWDSFLKERSVSSTIYKSFYTYKTLRSAYFSLKRNMPWLFTFEEFPELMMPNFSFKI
ncbi:hypothetical protein [Flavobacterium sp. UBA6031]|uniref:hypothetical protein n=1 Tax=Flavobacterium sp. UBA6031 TaxID=1946551 RepID=UPI0025C53CEB|nr:hypothetical protein [Flavobacterium sp. UBA6031]